MVTRIGSKRPIRVFIREWRDHRKLSQEKLAARLGTTKASVSRWETSTRAPTLTVLTAIADALDIEVQQIFVDPARPSADALLAGASEKQKQTAVDLVKTFLESDKKDGTDG